jgi:hypothetical protein
VEQRRQRLRLAISAPPPPTPTPTPSPTPLPNCANTHPPANWAGWESSAWGAYRFAHLRVVVPSVTLRVGSGANFWVGFNGDCNEGGLNAYNSWVRVGVAVGVSQGDGQREEEVAAFYSVRTASGYQYFLMNDSPAVGNDLHFAVWYDGTNMHFDYLQRL